MDNLPITVATFLKAVITMDIDGKEYELTCENKKAVLRDVFAKNNIWEGPAPKGPYGLDYAKWIIVTIENLKIDG